MHPPLPGDKAAGFTALVAGAVAIFLILFGIVELTNKKFERREHHRAAHGAPAAPAPAR
jgi:hypothetical protein